MNIARFLFSLCGTFVTATASAAPPAVPLPQLVVDVVMLKQGKPLRGAVVEQQPDGSLLMVVSDSWLKLADPVRYDRAIENHFRVQTAAWKSTLERIQVRLAEPVESPRLKFFLEQEQSRLTKLLESPPTNPDFLWIELLKLEVARVIRPTPERQRLGIMAWYSNLADVESRSVVSLRKELTELEFSLDGPLPDLGPRLAAREQNDQEWQARLAIIEHGLSSPVDFQGTGETVVRTGTGQTLDWQAILPGLIEQETHALLDELTGISTVAKGTSTAWLKPASEQTRKLNRLGFRVTRVTPNAKTSQVTVESRFVARVGEEDWQTIWSSTHAVDSRHPRLELEAQITADPQVQAILKTVQVLNVVGEDVVKTAIRHGAATMDAQATADAEFFRFRDRYLQRLDGPYLPPNVD